MNLNVMSIIKSFSASVILVIASLMFMSFSVVPASAQVTPDPDGSLFQGSCLSTDPADCPDTNPDESINNIIATVINVFSLVVGVVAVIMIIIGGFKYITSGGDSGNVTGAKNTILYAIIGLVVVALAQIIVQFVLNRATV